MMNQKKVKEMVCDKKNFFEQHNGPKHMGPRKPGQVKSKAGEQ